MKFIVLSTIIALTTLNAHALVGAAKVANGVNAAVTFYLGKGDCEWSKAQLQSGAAEVYHLESDIEYLLISTNDKTPSIFPIRREGTYFILLNQTSEYALFDGTENREFPSPIRSLNLHNLGCESFHKLQ
jgi:hypothetical protein